MNDKFKESLLISSASVFLSSLLEAYTINDAADDNLPEQDAEWIRENLVATITYRDIEAQAREFVERLQEQAYGEVLPAGADSNAATTFMTWKIFKNFLVDFVHKSTGRMI